MTHAQICLRYRGVIHIVRRVSHALSAISFQGREHQITGNLFVFVASENIAFIKRK